MHPFGNKIMFLHLASFSITPKNNKRFRFTYAAFVDLVWCVKKHTIFVQLKLYFYWRNYILHLTWNTSVYPARCSLKSWLQECSIHSIGYTKCTMILQISQTMWWVIIFTNQVDLLQFTKCKFWMTHLHKYGCSMDDFLQVYYVLKSFDTSARNQWTHKIFGVYFWRLQRLNLVVGLRLDPASWVVPKYPLPQFVKNKDEGRKWHSREPPVELEGVHFQALVHARGVWQEGSQKGLKN